MNCVRGLAIESGLSGISQVMHRPLPVAGVSLAFALTLPVSALAVQQNAPEPAQQSAPQPAYVAETVPLAVGNTIVNLHYIRVLTQPLGSAALDDVYGVLGIDALDQFKSYTFDYRTMRFSATEE